MKLKTGFLVFFFGTAAFSACIAQSADNLSSYVRPAQQATPATPNITTLSLGLAFGGYYPYAGATYVENPGVTLMGETAIFKHVGPGSIDLGGLLSYKSIYSSYSDFYTNYDYEQRWNYYIFGGRLSYHINPFANKSIETYAGFMLGYYLTTFTFNSDDPNYAAPTDPGYGLNFNNYPSFYALSVYMGLRSWVTSHSSVWIEVGYGYTSLAFGVSYKI